jgi:polysaccharide biosynthesis/export protein
MYEMNGRVLRLVIFIFASTAAAGAASLTNSSDRSWPSVPLSPPSSSIDALPPTALASNPLPAPAGPSANTTKSVLPADLPPALPASVEPGKVASNNTISPQNVAGAQNTTNTTNAAAGGNYNLDDNHQLEPGDSISFQILEDKNDPLNESKGPKTLTVTDSSEVDLPYLGLTSVSGKTCKELAAELKTLLEKDYYYHATVIVGLNSINQVRGQVFISGMVHTQGALDILFNRNLTVGEALLRMGGLDDFADKKQVKLIRNRESGTNEEVMILNMEDVLDKGQINKDVVLQPGDFIIVPARMLNF